MGVNRYLKYILLILILSSCNFNANMSFENEDKEKILADSIINNFYHYIDSNDYNNIMNLFSDEFFKVTPEKSLKEIFLKTKKDLGIFKNYELTDWQTNRIEGTNPRTEYLLTYEVTYSNFKAQEIFSLVKEGKIPKIVGYEVRAPQYLKK